jgi:hypothetical protein
VVMTNPLLMRPMSADGQEKVYVRQSIRWA